MLLERFLGDAHERGLLPGGVVSGMVSDWGAALTLVIQQAILDSRSLVIVLDECQYLLDREPSLALVLQRIWDTYSSRLGLHIVLCGSALTTMARLGESSQPLHGRFDLKLHLQPFNYLQASQFVPQWAGTDKLRLYGIFGGLARHLAYVDSSEDLVTNLSRVVLDPLGPLNGAPYDILRAERLSAPADSEAVLTALALGETRFNAIAARTGLAAPRLDSVIKEMIALDIIHKDTRFGDNPNSKFVRYQCIDPFMTFWFRFVRSNRNALLSMAPGAVFQQRIAPQLDQHMGSVFEWAVRQALVSGLLSDRFGPLDEIGRYWSRDGKTEIDIVARSGQKTLFVECKWRDDSVVRQSDLVRLRDHVHRSSLATKEATLCLASAGAFSDGLRQAAQAENVILLGLKELLGPRPPGG